MKQKNLPWTFDVVFWLLYFIYEWFGLAALSGDYESYFINACVALPLAFSVSFFTVHVLLKRFYDKWPGGKFWAVQITISVLILLLKRGVNYFFIYPRFFPQALGLPFFSFGKLIVEFVNLYLIVGAYSLFYFVINWYEQRQHLTELEEQKTRAELELLKGQVQPHFMFNALNSIYTAAVKNNPETPSLISYLSSFLSYNLYDAKQDFVPLDSEIVYLKSYLGLQCNRFGDKLDVSINVFDDVEGILIAPLLLLPLVENSFKHGVSNSINNSWVRIDISTQTDKFLIKIENSLEEQEAAPPSDNSGIGLKNVQKRLQLIYPGRHEFKTLKERSSYLVVVKINFSDDQVPHR